MGNITESMCYEGYEVPFALNHITYRGYYRDEEHRLLLSSEQIL